MRKLSTRLSRLVYALCQDEARKSMSKEVTPEHILLAMVKNADGLGYLTLKFLKLNILTFQMALEQYITEHSDGDFSDSIEIPSSRRVKTLLDIADLEAQAFNNQYIGTEHLLLAAIRESGSLTSRYFDNAKIHINVVRDAVKIVQKDYTSSFSDKIAKDIAASTIGDLFGRSAIDEFAEFLKSDSALDDEAVLLNSFGRKNDNQPKKQSRKESDSILNEFSRDITKLCREGKIDPVVGREKEINRIIQILSRRTKNNPCLVGEPGVGKTAIVEGLAHYIAKGNVPSGLMHKKVLSLDIGAVVAGTKYRGEFEERMKRIMTEVREDGNIILFIDELHTIIGAGGPEGQMDASNMIKPALSRGELQIVGATTTKEFTKYIEKDSALERRFQKVNVEEPSDEDTVKILEGIKNQYEKFHGVTYENGVIPLIVKLSRRYIQERCLPDKAIDILDEAGAQKKIIEEDRPLELIELEKQIDAVTLEKQELVKQQDYESAAQARDKVIELKKRLDLFTDFWKQNGCGSNRSVTTHDICSIIGEMTGIPLDQLDVSESERLINMEDEMHRTVIGQTEAVHTISGAIRRSRAGISSPKRPIGSFIFLGPTGVGKTQLAKALAKFLFGSEEQLIRIDMSDFMEKHNASRLVGAPPGYVGYEDGGVLTEQVRRHPYSVVLLDEIEKAHPDVFNLLLQLLEEGELSDNLGHTVNFRNTVIIMTSNAGARQITSDGRLGFCSSQEGVLPYDEIKSNAMNELKKLLSPELINRIDDVIVFEPLNKKEISDILDIQIKDLSDRLAEKNLKISLKPKARNYLVENGYEPSMGARPMRRLLQREIEDPLSIELLNRKDDSENEIIIDFVRGKLTVSLYKAELVPEETVPKETVSKETVSSVKQSVLK